MGKIFKELKEKCNLKNQQKSVKRFRDHYTYAHNRPAFGKCSGCMPFYSFGNKVRKYNPES